MSLAKLCARIATRDELESLLIEQAAEADALRSENEKLRAVAAAARDVVRWDWSDNDSDCVADITALSMALDETPNAGHKPRGEAPSA